MNNKRYVNGVVFIGDSFYDPSDSSYRQFDSTYSQVMKKAASKYTLFGYDTMKLILDQLSSGASSTEKLALALGRIAGYRGIHSKVTLTSHRVNSEIQILKYENGEVKKIGEISVN